MPMDCGTARAAPTRLEKRSRTGQLKTNGSFSMMAHPLGYLVNPKPLQMSPSSRQIISGVSWTVTQEIGTNNLPNFIEFAGQEERRKLPRRHNFNEMDNEKFQQLFLSIFEKKVDND